MRRPHQERDRTNRRIRSRSLVGVLMGAAGLVVLPAAIAWACAPSTAQIDFDRSPPSYKGSESVTVFGSGFAPNNPVELTLQAPSGASQAVAPGTNTTDRGGFEASFTLPSDAAPGDYALQAKTVPSGAGHGGQTQPTTATKTFKLVASQGSPPVPLPGFLAPESPPPPAESGDQPVKDKRAARRRAIAKCKRRHRAKKGSTARNRRKLAKRRAVCVRKAKKRFR